MLIKKSSAVVLGVALGILSAPVLLNADSTYHPTRDGGNFGIGLELGDPGSWGVDGKVWIDHENAFQGAVKIPGGSAILQLDYLWHDFGLIRMKSTQGEWPFYIGMGGDLTTASPMSLGARVPVGMSYIFNKKDVPVDIYLQLVPTIWFSGNATFNIYPELGAHYYF